MRPSSAVVIEDNGGGLHIGIRNRQGNIRYAHSGYEYCQGQLLEDLRELAAGGDPDEWDGNELSETGWDWRDEDRRNGGWACAAEMDLSRSATRRQITLYPSRWGSAATLELGSLIPNDDLSDIDEIIETLS